MKVDVEPPTKKELGVMTIAAVSLAIVVLIFAVLPAEYGIDPTGFGKAVGLVDDGPATADVSAVNIQNGTFREETFSIELPASGAWRETKFEFTEGMTVVFDWNTTWPIQYDLHSDKLGSFDRGQAADRAGSFTAPQDGAYGWAWRAVDGEAHTITLRLSGYWVE